VVWSEESRREEQGGVTRAAAVETRAANSEAEHAVETVCGSVERPTRRYFEGTTGRLVNPGADDEWDRANCGANDRNSGIGRRDVCAFEQIGVRPAKNQCEQQAEHRPGALYALFTRHEGSLAQRADDNRTRGVDRTIADARRGLTGAC
jgi:hypothetical protein